MDLLCSPEKRNNEDLLKKGVEIVRSSGALEKCRQKAKQMVEPEWENFLLCLNQLIRKYFFGF